MEELIALRADIPDMEERALKLLGKLLNKPYNHPKVFGIPEKETLKQLEEATTIEEVHEVSPHVAATVVEMVERAMDKKRAESLRKYTVRSENKSEYKPTAILVHKETEDKEGNTIQRFQGELTLECAGLVARMQHYYHGETAEPVAVSILNTLPPDEETGLKHAPINVVHLDNMNGIGLQVSQQKVAWNKSSPGYQWVLKAFPSAIDFPSYNHSLKAPLVPGGYFPDVEVTFTNLYTKRPVGIAPELALGQLRRMSVEDWAYEVERNNDRVPKGEDKETYKLRKKLQKKALRQCGEEIKELIKESNFEEALGVLENYDLTYLLHGKGEFMIDAPMKDDGSGRIHPDHPLFQEFFARYGHVCVQVRMLDTRGTFAKGILVPDDRCVDENGNPAIWVSWAQVKGKWKDLAKKRIGEDAKTKIKLHIGVLQVWDRKREISGCFENLENSGLPMQEKFDNETIEMMEESIQKDACSLVDSYMDNLAKDGLNGLLAAVSKDDPGIALIVKLIAKAKSMDVDFNPMGVDRLREAIEKKLQKKLWTAAQGAGIKGMMHTMVIDHSLRPGQIVTGSYPVGQELAMYRFPMILPQGLMTPRNIPPKPHHLVGAKVTEETYEEYWCEETESWVREQ